MAAAMFVYTTWPTLVEAEGAGQALVEARLAACVNILPGMVSIYRWQDAVERAGEVVMIIKTRAGLVEQVRAAVRDRHPYDVPAFVAWEVPVVDPDYRAWLEATTAG